MVFIPEEEYKKGSFVRVVFGDVGTEIIEHVMKKNNVQISIKKIDFGPYSYKRKKGFYPTFSFDKKGELVFDTEDEGHSLWMIDPYTGDLIFKEDIAFAKAKYPN